MSKSIYCWHEPAQRAIKVGVGSGPHGRMVDYSREYGLQPDRKSLRVFEVPEGLDARLIEQYCHDMLIKDGLTRFPVVSELFRLETMTYDAAAEHVMRLAEHCVDCFRRGDKVNYNYARSVTTAEKHEPLTPWSPGHPDFHKHASAPVRSATSTITHTDEPLTPWSPGHPDLPKYLARKLAK
jgi:hypothetical protein